MSALWERVRRGQPLADCAVIDLHGHLGRCAVPAADPSVETHLRTMDRIGVDCAVVSHTHCMSWDSAEGNEEVLAAMRAFPGRLLGYVTLWPGDAEAARREMELRMRQGFIGVKLHNANGFRYTDPGYAPALAIANERRLPVLLHTWGDAPTFADVRALAPRYPDAAFLLGHAGVLAEDTYIALAREFPNVYLDPTMSRTPRGLWERLVEAVGADKLTWGSDALFYSMTPHPGKVAGAKISEEAKRMILGGNARRLVDRAHIETVAAS
ncbi:MAG TPA: amidohydrolase family protein [Armatimonadota bacterium]|nr:amidohydrolase family protein [Armatimonadota bacterium]